MPVSCNLHFRSCVSATGVGTGVLQFTFSWFLFELNHAHGLLFIECALPKRGSSRQQITPILQAYVLNHSKGGVVYGSIGLGLTCYQRDLQGGSDKRETREGQDVVQKLLFYKGWFDPLLEFLEDTRVGRMPGQILLAGGDVGGDSELEVIE